MATLYDIKGTRTNYLYLRLHLPVAQDKSSISYAVAGETAPSQWDRHQNG